MSQLAVIVLARYSISAISVGWTHRRFFRRPSYFTGGVLRFMRSSALRRDQIRMVRDRPSSADCRASNVRRPGRRRRQVPLRGEGRHAVQIARFCLRRAEERVPVRRDWEEIRALVWIRKKIEQPLRGEAVATQPCPWSRAFVGAEVASSFVLWMTEPCRHRFRAPRFGPWHCMRRASAGSELCSATATERHRRINIYCQYIL